MMDQSERQRFKVLANDSIIETFGTECPEQRLAEALEKALEHIEHLRQWRPICDCGLHLMTYNEHEEDGLI